MKRDFAVRLIHISKKYILHHQKPTLVESFFHRRQEFWALKDINLEITKGERLGIIGKNGSGKSTLLKIISGITAPTSGRIEVNGRIASLIELTAGFHPELTGNENIDLNGLLIGMSREEIRERKRKIIDFSGLGQFIDAPLYTYSGGMMLRLGLSVALFSRPEIIVIDEIFSAGDFFFRQKAKARFRKILPGKTLIYVSHDLDSIKELCQHVCLMDKGRIVDSGKPEAIIRKYIL